jgi:RNA polymerase sigma factor (sigma-70 family)
MTDEDVMAAVSKGDLEKTAILYERYKARLFGFFRYHYRYEPHRSADFTQQVFVRLLQYRRTYRSNKCFERWIFRIARNPCHDDFQYHNQRLFVSLDEASEVPLEEENGEEESILVRWALSMLTEESQEILRLSRLEGLPYELIAQQLGCSIPAVKMRIHRAIRRLREIYIDLSES